MNQTKRFEPACLDYVVIIRLFILIVCSKARRIDCAQRSNVGTREIANHHDTSAMLRYVSMTLSLALL
jgi:hypothetical protein